MNILITGGTGLIGRHFINAHHDEHRFTVLTRNKVSAQRRLTPSCQFIESLDQLKNLNAFDAVINLAGEPIVDKRWTEKQKTIITNSRLDITNRLVELFEQSEEAPEVFISGSAIGFYGRQDDTVINEQFTDVHAEFSHDLCAKWEASAQRASTATTRVCILRTGIVLSEDGGALDKMLLPFKLGAGGPIASGKQYMSWIHISDMISAINHLLVRPISQGIYNFTAPNPETNAAFAKKLGQALNRPTILPMPEFALRMLMGEAADLLVYGQRVVPDELVSENFEFLYPTLEDAFTHLLD